MEWLIGEYWPWLAFSAVLGAGASVAFTLRKVEVHTPPQGEAGSAPPLDDESAPDPA